MARDLSGLILAGGRSRRFGSDKALATLDGLTFIARVYEALAPLCDEVLVGVGTEQRSYALPGPARFVRDRASIGPLGGLESGLAEAAAPWLLVVTCDLPYLRTDVLRALADARGAAVDAIVGVTPDGRRHPLCSCYHRGVLPMLREQIAGHRLAVHALLDRLAVREVPAPADALRNVNTPADLKAD